VYRGRVTEVTPRELAALGLQMGANQRDLIRVTGVVRRNGLHATGNALPEDVSRLGQVERHHGGALVSDLCSARGDWVVLPGDEPCRKEEQHRGDNDAD
jgi:hypothetical protein